MITFCIPSHNREDKFNKTLNTLKQQTDQNFKIIVSNSSENDYDLNFLNNFSNIEYYHNPHFNIFDNYNNNFNNIKTDYYMQLEDDDLIIRRDFVENINKILIKYKPDLLITNYINNVFFSNSVNKIKNKLINISKIDLSIDNFYKYFNTDFQFGQVIFNSKYIINLDIYNLGYNIFSDEIFLLEILKNFQNLNIYKTDLVSYLLNIHDSNFSISDDNIIIYSLVLYINYLIENFEYSDIKNLIKIHLEKLNLDKLGILKYTEIKDKIFDINKKFLLDLNNKEISWEKAKDNLKNNLKDNKHIWSN
jgi:glycosyltransferase involved in cell wall biosynthesis